MADRRTRVKRLLTSALLPVLLLPVLPTAGAQLDTSLRDRLRSEAQEYEQLLEERRAEVARLEAELGDTRARLQERIAERDRISSRVAELEAERRELQARRAEVEAERAATEARIEEAEAELALLRERIRALLVDLHRRRAGRSAAALASAETLHDLQVKSHYLTLLSRRDVQLVEEVEARRAELAELEGRLAGQIQELEAAEAELADNLTTLEASRADLQAIIDELDQTRAGQQAQRAALLEAQNRLERDLSDTERRLQDEIARLEEEERRLRDEAERFVNDRERREALLQEADETRERILNLTSPQEANDEGFVAPLEEAALLSEYGDGNSSFVALRAAEEEAPVFAVQGGVVIASQSIGANDGFMVAVRHDDVLTTVYTNLHPPDVQVGDQVARGQAIGFVGGGTIPPPDVLRLYARVREGGREAFVDPRTALGL